MFLFLTLFIPTIVCLVTLVDVRYVISYRLQCNQNYPVESGQNLSDCWQILAMKKKTPNNTIFEYRCKVSLQW